MKQVSNFLIDFCRAFLEFALIALFVIVDFLLKFLCSVKTFYKNFIVPNIIELLADLDLFINIILQSVYSLLSSSSLFFSKSFLIMSEHFHKKSESIIHKKWEIR